MYEGVYSNAPVVLVDFYTKCAHLNNMKYELYADVEGHGFGDLITDRYDLKITKGDAFEELIMKVFSNRTLIVNKQTNKLNYSISIGKMRCRALFQKANFRKKRPKTFLLDVVFFKFRRLVLILRSYSV
ncbi:hypothetical protein H4J42_18725 [Colwellia sp. BRX8-8]|nr:hypothetical protein [Colwellia sp. BRX8-8]